MSRLPMSIPILISVVFRQSLSTPGVAVLPVPAIRPVPVPRVILPVSTPPVPPVSMVPLLADVTAVAAAAGVSRRVSAVSS